MPACRCCGKENPEDARFCNECGAPLGAEPAAPREVRKTVTVLFSDVTGSTALGERLDPEAVRRVMARWSEAMRSVVERHGGTVEKFVGDAVMAVFGIPVLHEDDALRAVRAAAEMRNALAALDEELERDYRVRIESRTGVNTGEVVAGEGETLATGDAVNVAARLEQAAAPGEIMLGEQTLRLVRDAVEAEAVEPLALKGKSDLVAAYRLVRVRAGAPAFARRLDAPMVGRELELAQLRQAYERAVRERAAILFTVLGTAGIGKSRLAQELLDGVRGDTTVLRGRCLPYGEGITFWPLLEMLQEAAHHELRARLVEMLAGEQDAELIAGRLAAAVGAADWAGSTEETFWAVRKLFERLARERPLVVVLDDLHWAEPTFLDLVDHVADWSRDAPILLLCLARPELLELRPDWAGGKLNATSFLLEPLSGEESQELIDRLRGESDLAAETRARIAAAAEGNPLFVEQMLAMLSEDGEGAGEMQVPPTIQALLAARLDRLGREERAVIERASVEGKVFHRGAVVELAPEELRPAVGSHLLALVRKELIRPDRATFERDDAFRFRNLLIRDAAYEAMPKETRAELHERFAGWLERAAGDRAGEFEEIVGYHLEQAYRYRAELGPVDAVFQELARRAAEKLIASGRNALARSDLPAAVGLLMRGVELLPAEDAGRLGVLPELAEALVESGEFAPANALLAEALASRDERIAARARLVQVSAATQTGGSAEEALAEAERAAEVLEHLGDTGGLARAQAVIGRMRFFLGRCSQAESAYELAEKLAREAGDRRLEYDALEWHIGAKRYGTAPVAETIAFCDEVLARQAGNAQLDSFALAVRGQLEAMEGHFEEARAFVARGRVLVEDFGLTLRKGANVLEAADVELLAGDLAAAERVLREGYEILEALGETGFRSTVGGQLAEVLWLQGRDTEAERLLREVREIAAADDVEPQMRWRAVLARILARRGEHGDAERLAREAVALVEATEYLDSHAGTLMALADVLRLAGRLDEGVAAVEQALALYERKGNVVVAVRSRALLEELAVEPR